GQRRGRELPRGRLVEAVRLVFITLLGTAGYRIGTSTATDSTTTVLLSVFLGSAIGYVVGGAFGRVTFRAVTGLEQDLRRRPAPVVAGGSVGLVVGLLVSALLMIPL